SASGVSGDRTQPSQGGTDFWLIKVAPEITEAPPVAEKEAFSFIESTDLTREVRLDVAPNPFAEITTVHFTLPATELVTLKVYDNQGQEITTLFRGEAQPNQKHALEWKAENLTSGMYFLQLQTSTKTYHYKVIVIK
ncbi:MAG: T9SS type A sorting domain-containing protein, partial [Bacteroidota bacterium]|nr:T9SS type A sorting domain-containing protein [Bacteroidota bacterium]